MRFLFFTLAALTCFNLYADVVMLEKKNIHIGSLNQSVGQPGTLELIVVRNSKTPEKVNLQFGISIFSIACERYPESDIYYHHRTGEMRERPSCHSYKEKWEQVPDTIQLNFKKAKKLEPGVSEVFSLRLKQKDSKSVKISAEVDTFDSSADYEVMFNSTYQPSFMVKPKLKFLIKN
ncbi:MAG: hypothetical protein JNM93_06245 [Bacteriovoracaceae bacterium]|nr:hypothetical protein [Bacteriovoracaceae bacterium]